MNVIESLVAVGTITGTIALAAFTNLPSALSESTFAFTGVSIPVAKNHLSNHSFQPGQNRVTFSSDSAVVETLNRI